MQGQVAESFCGTLIARLSCFMQPGQIKFFLTCRSRKGDARAALSRLMFQVALKKNMEEELCRRLLEARLLEHSLLHYLSCLHTGWGQQA